PSWVLAKAFFPMNEFGTPLLIGGAVFLGFGGFSWWYCFSKIAARRRQNHVEILRTATRLGEIVSPQAQRLLIIRAIDDEASLVLTFNTIANSFISRAIKYPRWNIFGTNAAILLSFLKIRYFKLSFEQGDMLKLQKSY